MISIVLLVTVLFALGRFAVPTVKPDFSLTGIYKTAAHFYVAGLMGYAIGTGESVWWVFAGALTAVELFAFFRGHNEEH